ncbi:hypothetical protein [Streptomyces sp. NPDC017991]
MRRNTLTGASSVSPTAHLGSADSVSAMASLNAPKASPAAVGDANTK